MAKIKLIGQGCEKNIDKINEEIENKLGEYQEELTKYNIEVFDLLEQLPSILNNDLDTILSNNVELVLPEQEGQIPYLMIGDKPLTEVEAETLTNEKIVNNFGEALNSISEKPKDFITDEMNRLNIPSQKIGEAINKVGDILHKALFDLKTGNMFNIDTLLQTYKDTFNKSLPTNQLDKDSSVEDITHHFFPYIMQGYYDFLVKHEKIDGKSKLSIAIDDVIENNVEYDENGNVITVEDNSVNEVRQDLFFKATDPPKISKLVKFLLSRLGDKPQDPITNVMELFGMGKTLMDRSLSTFIKYIDNLNIVASTDLLKFLKQLTILAEENNSILNNKPKQLLLALGSYALSNVSVNYIEVKDTKVSVTDMFKQRDVTTDIARALEGGNNSEVKNLKTELSTLIGKEKTNSDKIIKLIADFIGGTPKISTYLPKDFVFKVYSLLNSTYDSETFFQKINQKQEDFSNESSIATILNKTIRLGKDSLSLSQKGLDGKSASKYIKPNRLNTFNKTITYINDNDSQNPDELFNLNPFFDRTFKVFDGSYLLKGKKPNVKSDFFQDISNFNLDELTDVDYKLYKQDIYRPNVQSDAPNPQYVKIQGIKKYSDVNLNQFIDNYADFVGKFINQHGLYNIKNDNLNKEITLLRNIYNPQSMVEKGVILTEEQVLQIQIQSKLEYEEYLEERFANFEKYLGVVNLEIPATDVKDFWFSYLQVHYFMQPFLGGDIMQFAGKSDPITQMIKRSRESGGYLFMQDDEIGVPKDIISIYLSKVDTKNESVNYSTGVKSTLGSLDGQTFTMPHYTFMMLQSQGGDFQQLIEKIKNTPNNKKNVSGNSGGAVEFQKESDHTITPDMIAVSPLYEQMYKTSLNIHGYFENGVLNNEVINFGLLNDNNTNNNTILLENTISEVVSNVNLANQIKALFTPNRTYNTLLEIDTAINQIMSQKTGKTFNYEAIYLVVALNKFKALKTNKRMVHQIVPPDSRKANTPKSDSFNINIDNLSIVANEGITTQTIQQIPLISSPSRNVYIQQNPNHEIGNNQITLMTQLVSAMVFQEGNVRTELKQNIAELLEVLKDEIPILKDDESFLEVAINSKLKEQNKGKKITQKEKEEQKEALRPVTEQGISEAIQQGRNIVLKQILSDLIASRDNMAMQLELSSNDALLLANSPKYTTLISNQINAFMNKVLKPKLNGDIFVLREGSDIIQYRKEDGTIGFLEGIKLQRTYMKELSKGKQVKKVLTPVTEIINPIEIPELTELDKNGNIVLKKGDNYLRSFQEYLEKYKGELKVIPHDVALPLNVFKKHFPFVEAGVDLDRYNLDTFVNYYSTLNNRDLINTLENINNSTDLKKDIQKIREYLSLKDIESLTNYEINLLQDRNQNIIYSGINEYATFLKEKLTSNNPTIEEVVKIAQKKFNQFQQLRKTIVTRVPTTGKHSGGVSIVRTLIDINNNTIFVPQELLDIQGADLDVDKGISPLFSLKDDDKSKITNKILDILYNELVKPTTFLESVRPVSIKEVKATANFVIKNLAIKEKNGTLTELEKTQNFLLNNDRASMYWIWTNLLRNIQGKGQVGVFATGQKVYAGIMMAVRDLENQMKSFIEGFTIENLNDGLYDDNEIVKRYNKLHPNTTLYLPKVNVDVNGEFETNEDGSILWEEVEVNRWGNTTTPNSAVQTWLQLSALVNSATDNGNDPVLSVIGSTNKTASFVATASMLEGLPKSYLLFFSDSEVLDIINKWEKSYNKTFEEYFEKIVSKWNLSNSQLYKFNTLIELERLSNKVRQIGQILGINQGLNYKELQNKQLVKSISGLQETIDGQITNSDNIVLASLESSPDMMKAQQIAQKGDEIRKAFDLVVINVQNKIFDSIERSDINLDSLPNRIIERLVVNYLNSKQGINTNGTSHKDPEFLSKFPAVIRAYIRSNDKMPSMIKRLRLDSNIEENSNEKTSTLLIKNVANIPAPEKMTLSKEISEMDSAFRTNFYYYNLIVNKDLFGKNKISELFANTKEALEFTKYIESQKNDTQWSEDLQKEIEEEIQEIFKKKGSNKLYGVPIKNTTESIQDKDAVLIEPTDKTTDKDIKKQSKSEYRNVAINNLIKDLIAKLGIKYNIPVLFRNSEELASMGLNNSIAGFVKDNVIYLNEDYMGADTPLHEFIHVYFAVLKKSNPDAYTEVMREMSNIPQIKRMIEKKKAQGYSEIDVVEEAVVEVLGVNLMKHLIPQAWYKNMLNWIIDLFKGKLNMSFKYILSEQYKKDKIYLKQILQDINTEFKSDEIKKDYYIALKEQKTEKGLYNLTGKDLSSTQNLASIIKSIEYDERHQDIITKIRKVQATENNDKDAEIRKILVDANLIYDDPISLLLNTFNGVVENTEESVEKALESPAGAENISLTPYKVEGFPEVLIHKYTLNGVEIANMILPTQSNLVKKSFGTLFNKTVVNSNFYNTNRDAGYTALYLSSIKYMAENPNVHLGEFKVFSIMKGSKNEMIHIKEASYVKKEFDKIYYKTNGKVDDKIKDRINDEITILLEKVNPQQVRVPYRKMYSNLLGNQSKLVLQKILNEGTNSKEHLSDLKKELYNELETADEQTKKMIHRVLLEIQNVDMQYTNGLNTVNAFINNPSSFIAPLLQHLSALSQKMMSVIASRFNKEFKSKQDVLRIKMLQAMNSIVPELKAGNFKGYREYDKYLWETNKDGKYTGRIINHQSTPIVNPEQWAKVKYIYQNKDIRAYIDFTVETIERYYNEAFVDKGKGGNTFTTMIANDLRKGDKADFIKYQIPIIDGKLAQTLFNSNLSVEDKLKMGVGKLFANMNDAGVVVEDINKPHNISDIELRNMFMGQIYPNSRANMLGLNDTNEKEANLKNQNIELNIESVLGFFAITQIRTHEYFKNRYDYEAVETVLMEHATSGQGEVSLEMRVIKELFYQTILTDTKLLNRNDDQRLDKTMDFLGRGTSFLALSGDLFTGLSSWLTGQWNLISTSLQGTLGANTLFGFTDFIKAHKIMAGIGINNIWENTRKVWGDISKTEHKGLNKIDLLFKHFRLLDMDYNKLVGNANMVSGNVLHELPYLALQAGDYYNKGIFMIATMIKDGSWNAYSVEQNKDTGEYELKYDYTKDKRFSEPNAELLKDYLIREGLTDEKGKLTGGYSDDMMMKIRKLSSDAFGSFSKEEQAIAQNYALGRFVMIFRRWIAPKLTRYYGGRTENFIHYGNLQKVTDENGVEKMVWNGSFNEGILLSVLSFASEVASNPMKAWSEMNNVQKDNLKAFFVNSASMLGLLAILFSMFDEDERKRKGSLSRWLWDSMIDFRLMVEPASVTGLVSSPSVAKSYIEQMWSVLAFMMKIPFDLVGFDTLDEKQWINGGKTMAKFFSNPIPLVGDYLKIQEFKRSVNDILDGDNSLPEWLGGSQIQIKNTKDGDK